MSGSDPIVYTHSGALGPACWLMPTVGLAVGVVMAVVYAVILVWCPVIGYVNVLFLAGYAFALGMTLAWAARRGKCRNQGFVLLAASVVSLVAWYLSWVAFVYTLIARFADSAPAVSELMVPGELWRAVNAINTTGWYELFGGTVKGGMLWLIWAVEAVVMIGGPVFIAASGITREMFCERCVNWCTVAETRFFALTADLSPSGRTPSIRELLALPPLAAKEYPCVQAEVLACPECGKSTGLRYAVLRQERDKNGQLEEQSDDIPGLFQMP